MALRERRKYQEAKGSIPCFPLEKTPGELVLNRKKKLFFIALGSEKYR